MSEGPSPEAAGATSTAWTPALPMDGKLEDVTLEEWIGQAIGAASMCWSEPPWGLFESNRAREIAQALISHVQRVIDDVGAASARGVQHMCSNCYQSFESAELTRDHVLKVHR
jgi:hypothetical protein